MALLDRLNELIQVPAARMRGWALLEAAMAASALAACPDGKVSLARRVALDKHLATLEVFRDFEVHEAVNLFNGFADQIRDRPDQGRRQALRAVAGIAEDADAAALIWRMVSAISQADGRPATGNASRIAPIAEALGLGPSELTADPAEAEAAQAHVITIGNAKGGTGKSTVAVHLAVALLQKGLKVGTIDLDGGQGTLSRYFENRAAARARGGADHAMPIRRQVDPSMAPRRETARAEDTVRLRDAFAALADCDAVVVDTPGSASHLARLGHFNADTLITPVNDSFLDIDVLAKIDRERRAAVAPSGYARMIGELRERRREDDRKAVDWIVMRNRLAQIDARNSRDIAGLLGRLAERLDFRLIAGLSERVVFRELFDRGLTLLDLPEAEPGSTNARSRENARREVLELVEAIDLESKAASTRAKPQ